MVPWEFSSVPSIVSVSFNSLLFLFFGPRFHGKCLYPFLLNSEVLKNVLKVLGTWVRP